MSAKEKSATGDSLPVGPEPGAEYAPKQVGFAKFLENTPPSEFVKVEHVFLVKQSSHGGTWYELDTPELQLHCSSDICKEELRIFRHTDGERHLRSGSDEIQTYQTYTCSNCQQTRKRYSLYVTRSGEEWDSSVARCYKFGEFPPFGSPTPKHLLKLFGREAQIFLKGRQCENHALGIGAFSYYRRVVESHKDQIFDAIIKVTTKIAPDLVPGLERAKEEHQFLKAIESVKEGIPQGLLVNGHNPLTLLHSALSEGLHAGTDAQCLEAAHDVRVVLGALTERMAQALKDEAELNSAIGRLAKRKESS